jgi:hypothetical protein
MVKCLACGCKVHYEEEDKYSLDDDKYSHHLHCCSKKCLDKIEPKKKNELYLSAMMKYYYELKGH